ncbi:unnamed protein product [Didymodactylos carnosus]|uniref:Reverse transcriptase domain-containing protein n=1 Tax=Didymodactylos carnosus TaxID=1234261 RepID=A0A815BSY3_9BILA|nr:unnamed protein product [Didymodactylos carnosus]CAF4069464.1 unnamed protein product [Didymodactylos carnosus]
MIIKKLLLKNKRFKTIQETKRKWLNYFFNTYEFQIIECEQQYQCEFIKLQTQLLNNSTTNNSSSLFVNHIKELMNYLASRLQKDIYNEMSSFQQITIQNRERSSSSTATKHTIGVSLESYLDVIRNPFDTRQWNHLSLASEFEKKVENFFRDTHAFIELSYNPFNEIFDKVIQLLNKPQSNKRILQWQFKQNDDNIPIRSIKNTIRAVTRNISKFLDEILRRIFDKHCTTTTTRIIDGAHLITELTKHIKKGLFKSTTLLCTFDIENLFTKLPLDEALNILMEFLHVHG